MPKASTLQGNFSAGELSPLLNGRTDSPRYKQGLDTGLNMIPTLQGPLARRPATQFMNAVKDSSNPPGLIPFQFSITQSYMLEFGNQYIRFYANNGQIITSGTSWKVSGSIGISLPGVGSGFPFYATRATKNPNASEIISGSSSVSPGSVLELQSPYAAADVPLIRYAQNADTLYLVHPNYPPYKLQRSGQTYWEIQQVATQDGPYLPLNSYTKFGDSTNITLQALTASAATSDILTGPSFAVSGAVTDPGGSGQIQITTAAHNYVSGQYIYLELVGGTTEANNANPHGGTFLSHPYYWQIQVVSSTQFLLLGSTFTNAYTSGGNAYPALFWNNFISITNDTLRPIALIIAGARYWGNIFAFGNAARVSVMLGQYVTPTNFPSTAVATAWQIGVYSYGNGFPATVCFHQNRLVFAGCPNSPQEVDFSYTGQYENFAASAAQTNAGLTPPQTALQTVASSALQFTLNSSDVNAIQWLKSTAQALLAGSYTSEWAMTPASSGDALSPTNFNANQTSFYGSATADAVQLGNAVLYIQRSNRKLREMNYFFQVGTFRSTDMTELSEHITNPGITKIAVQKETQPLIWAIRSDGALLTMIYNRDDASVQAGFTRHQLGGQSDSSGTPPIVTSIAVIPSPDLSFDQLWIVVKRFINGAAVYYIEYMTKIFDALALQEDAKQGDCGATYYVPQNITGISIANPCVVTVPTHGYSTGQRIKIVGVVGLGKNTTDVNGNITNTNLVNETTFLVGTTTTNTFTLTDYLGNPINSIPYGAWVSGGQVAAMVTTISGFTWLENETVSVLADGGLHPNVVVSSGGAITLQYPAAKVQVGYTFNSDGKLLRVEGGAADGTSIGKTRRTSRAAFQMYRIGQISVGTSFSNLIPVKFPVVDNQLADQPTPLFSGIKREGLESNYDFESQICFRQNSMLPGMIQSITSFMEEFDV